MFIAISYMDEKDEILWFYLFQFEKLWYTLGVNEFGNVDYRQFLQEYASRGAPVNKNMNNRAQTPSTARPGTGMSLRLGTSASMSSRLVNSRIDWYMTSLISDK